MEGIKKLIIKKKDRKRILLVEKKERASIINPWIPNVFGWKFPTFLPFISIPYSKNCAITAKENNEIYNKKNEFNKSKFFSELSLKIKKIHNVFMNKIEKFKIVLMLKLSIDEMNDDMKNKKRIWSILKENFFLTISFNNIMEINNKAPKICVNDIEFRPLDDITSGPKNLK